MTPVASSLTDMSGLKPLSIEVRMFVSSFAASSSLESVTCAPAASSSARSSRSERFSILFLLSARPLEASGFRGRFSPLAFIWAAKASSCRSFSDFRWSAWKPRAR